VTTWRPGANIVKCAPPKMLDIYLIVKQPNDNLCYTLSENGASWKVMGRYSKKSVKQLNRISGRLSGI